MHSSEAEFQKGFNSNIRQGLTTRQLRSSSDRPPQAAAQGHSCRLTADLRYADCDLDALRRACRSAGKAGVDASRLQKRKAVRPGRGRKTSATAEPSSPSDESGSTSSDDSISSADSAESTRKKRSNKGRSWESSTSPARDVRSPRHKSRAHKKQDSDTNVSSCGSTTPKPDDRRKERRHSAGAGRTEHRQTSGDSGSQRVGSSRTRRKIKHISFERSTSGSESDESSEFDGSDESDGTRFHERNKSYAAAVIKACGCTFCHMYKHLKLRHGKEIVRAAHKFIGTFRTPNIKAKTSSLRKWAHMLFWTRHHPADDGWRKLRSRERQYVVACLAVPSTGSSRTRLSFAKHAVEALWRDVEKKEQRG